MSDDQAPTRFDTLLGQMTETDGRYHVTAGPDWMQGRTLYGGISAALCLRAVRMAYPDLPALRSALIAFAGPSAGDVSIRPNMLRQGKSAAFVTADLTNEAGFGVHATFCFGANRVSAKRQVLLDMPTLPTPEEVFRPFSKDRPRPLFTDHFDMRLAKGALPVSGATDADIYWWLKALDSHEDFAEATLLALADAPPPAALSLFDSFTPLSTMTWMVDFLTDAPSSADGWYAAHLKSEAIGDGYSAQNSYLWASDGKPLLACRQTIALFG
jgi:acyl-CoA thioesterase